MPTGPCGGAFSLHVVAEAAGLIVCYAEGNAGAMFENELGMHRWVNIRHTPSGERLHTSTVAVVVMPETRGHEAAPARVDQQRAAASAIKRRTAYLHIGIVEDHISRRRWDARAYLAGEW